MRDYKCKMIKRKGYVYRHKNSYFIIVDKFHYLEIQSDNPNLSMKEIYDKLKESKSRDFLETNQKNFEVDKFLGIVLHPIDKFYQSKVKEYKEDYKEKFAI